VDSVMQEFNFETFYKNPKFHISLCWSLENPDKSIIETFKAGYKEIDTCLIVDVSDITVKTGQEVKNISLL